LIYNRLSGAVSKAAIYDAVAVICDELSTKLANGEPVAIDNFGMLDTYLHHGHEVMNINSGENQFVDGFKSVSFIPNKTFSDLLERKRDRFMKEGKP
jgi:nucleoid DNA-binding protein